MFRAAIICVFLALGSGEFAGTQVVLAHYNENLGWLSMLPASVAVTIYKKATTEDMLAFDIPAMTNATLEQLPNVGRESHTYLHHIVKNYERLAPWTVFSQAGEPSFGYRGHRSGGGHLLAGDDFKNYLTPDTSGSRFVHTAAVHLPSMDHMLRASYCINDDRLEGRGHPSACPKNASYWSPWFDIGDMKSYILKRVEEQRGENFMDFYHKYINQKHTEKNVMVVFPQGARFAVSRETIQQRPKAYYEKLLATLSNHVDSYAGYYMEWLWSELFQGHQESCSAPAKTVPVGAHEAMDALTHRFPDYRFPEFVRRLSGGGVSGGGVTVTKQTSTVLPTQKPKTSTDGSVKPQVCISGAFLFLMMCAF